MTTDNAGSGFAGGCSLNAAPGFRSQANRADAPDSTAWAFEIRGELEEALDALLLRAAFAETPTLSGLPWVLTN